VARSAARGWPRWARGGGRSRFPVREEEDQDPRRAADRDVDRELESNSAAGRSERERRRRRRSGEGRDRSGARRCARSCFSAESSSGVRFQM